MILRAKVYRVMLASPSDTIDERKEFPSILNDWNTLYSVHRKAVVLPVEWETHSTPEMGDRPQAIINKQLVDDADILVAVFWTKLGTATGAAMSGSVEEVQQFRSHQKPVLMYFSNVPVPPNNINIKQYQLLKKYREKCYQEGLVSSYTSIYEFRDLLLRNLWETVSRHPRTLKIENRGNLTKESLTPMKYDPKQTSTLIEKMMEQARLLTPQAKQELLRSLTQT